MTENGPPEESKVNKEQAEVEIKAEKESGSGTAATHNPKTYKTVICQYYLQGIRTTTIFLEVRTHVYKSAPMLGPGCFFILAIAPGACFLIVFNSV